MKNICSCSCHEENILGICLCNCSRKGLIYIKNKKIDYNIIAEYDLKHPYKKAPTIKSVNKFNYLKIAKINFKEYKRLPSLVSKIHKPRPFWLVKMSLWKTDVLAHLMPWKYDKIKLNGWENRKYLYIKIRKEGK